MSDEYTPTTEEVRGAWQEWQHRQAFRLGSETSAEFDRWLAARDARIRAEVIDWIETGDLTPSIKRSVKNARAHFGLTEGADRG